MSGIASEKKRKRTAVDQGREHGEPKRSLYTCGGNSPVAACSSGLGVVPLDGSFGPGQDSAGRFWQEDRDRKPLQMPVRVHDLCFLHSPAPSPNLGRKQSQKKAQTLGKKSLGMREWNQWGWQGDVTLE